MKNWQFFMLMWILCMIAYYAQDKESILPLLAAYSFQVATGIALVYPRLRNKNDISSSESV
jgi:hypothetical protein